MKISSLATGVSALVVLSAQPLLRPDNLHDNACRQSEKEESPLGMFWPDLLHQAEMTRPETETGGNRSGNQ